MDYDVIITGGSFAGLAAAQVLRDHRVLVVARHPIGTHQSSACATPLSTARAVGAEEAILEVHDALVLHTAGHEIRFGLEHPYATFGYQQFCRAMVAHTDAEICVARATGYNGNRVTTDAGDFSATYVIDATGSAAALSGGFRARQQSGRVAYGLETELPFRPDISPGLHFYFDRRYVHWGYAWAFPCGRTTRLGVGSFCKSKKLQRGLARLAAEFGQSVGAVHGGILSLGFHEPVIGDLFVVGDAAGQCLPLTGEGIRTAIYHGLHCGRTIRGALRGTFTPNEARALYRNLVLSHRHIHRRLWLGQRGVAWIPPIWLAAAARASTRLGLDRWLMDTYLQHTGWFLGHRWTGQVSAAHHQSIA